MSSINTCLQMNLYTPLCVVINIKFNFPQTPINDLLCWCEVGRMANAETIYG